MELGGRSSGTLNKKILVVDDAADTIFLLKYILEPEGFEVFGAGGGAECLKMLGSVNPDVVLLDIMMPDMDGWETFHKIRADDLDVPICIISARSQNFDRLLALNVLNANDYVNKPFDAEDLIGRVKAIFGMS
ncbi:response regulator [Methanococcoides sp. SA1]|nr:response regulator [Methanococcoides sp. SA1]